MKTKKQSKLMVIFLSFLVCISLVPMTAFAETVEVPINETNFPNANFRAFVVTKDTNGDGILSKSELNAVKKIDLYNSKINNFKGLEYFTNLENLQCGKNELTSLDVSKNTELIELSCKENKLTNLDISNNTKLKNLYCFENELTSLDVSNNIQLVRLACWTNKLTSLDLSKNSELVRLMCSNSQLTNLDVSKNERLEWLSCQQNQLANLDVSRNIKLKNLSCWTNKFTSLDVSKNIKLEKLECWGNRLTSLDVTKNLELKELHCDNNQLTSLDLSNNTKLTVLDYGLSRQKYAIEVDGSNLTFDLTSLPGSFDKSKASEWVGGTVSGNTLTLESKKPSNVSYIYQARAGKNIQVVLNIVYKKASIHFDANGGTGTMADATIEKGSSYKLPPCNFTAPNGKEFKAWKVNGVKKTVGDSITVNANTTVKAIWKEKTAIVITSSGNTNKEVETSPKTGDNGMMYIYALELVMAATGMLIINIRRNKKEQ